MPVKVSDLVKNERTVSLDFDGDTLNIRYRPNSLTVGIERRLAAAEGGEETIDAGLEALLALIVEWDLLGEDGKPLPVTKEQMEALPGVVLQ